MIQVGVWHNDETSENLSKQISTAAEGWLSELSELSELSDTIGGLSEDYRRTIEGLSDVHYLDYRTLSGW